MAQLTLDIFRVWRYYNNMMIDKGVDSMTYSYPTKAELLDLMVKTTFRAFTEADWWGFAGCETENPLIGEYNDFTIVIDGEMINIVHPEDSYGGQLYSLNQLA